MAEYRDFKHGTGGEIMAAVTNATNRGKTKQCIVYIGTAPVNQVEDGEKNVNRPILVENMADARKYLGYSDDWAKYTLCEAMHVHFDIKGVGPIVFINVLDPEKHRVNLSTSNILTPDNGRMLVLEAEDVILDTVKVRRDGKELEKGNEYTASYDFAKKAIVIREGKQGSLGTEPLNVTYEKVDASKVTTADVIGETDNYGLNTGVYAVKNVYNVTGCIPAYLLSPGFSNIPAVHTAMKTNSQQISKHWNAWMFVDMPIADTMGYHVTLENAADWKKKNGYNGENESVFYPLAKGIDGRKYHISVLNAANFQELLVQNNGIPYMSGSNTACDVIEDLYFGESVTGRVYDDEVINRCLNANGINSAAFVGGRWAIWGMFPGSYDQENITQENAFDTNMMMLYYLTNDFQHRRNMDIDKPMAVNDLKTIVAEEQSRVDALLGIGALTYGKVMMDASKQARSDVYKGDFRILFNVTNTLLAKSLTAVAGLTSEGFQIYFDAMAQ